LSGREIRTVLRTAFPRAIVDSPAQPCVRWEHLDSAIADVRASNRNVGKQRREAIDEGAGNEAGRRMLGFTD
jgi:hypothetical protein